MSDDTNNPIDTVTTTLKWFEQHKGFGFVHDEASDTDAFLHASVLKQAGYETLNPGTTIVCTLAEAQKGKQVISIISVDESTAKEEAPYPHEGSAENASELVKATVKFYNAGKGFGFATVDGMGKDVFLPRKLISYGHEPQAGQVIQLTYTEGARGLIAASIIVD